MDAHEAMRELCTILGVGDFLTAPTIEGCLAAVRRLAAERSEAHVLLDDACVAKHEPLPVRVGRLRDLVRRAQDGWAQANARLDQSNGELVAARGDLRVEKERADMLEKERDAANQELSETRQALGGFLGPDYRISEEVKKVVAARDMLAARVNELEGLPRGLGILIPAGVDLVDMLRKHAKACIVFEKRDGSGTKVLLKDNNALGWNGTTNRRIDFDAPATTTAVNPSKPGLQPMKCPCGGKIEFGRESVGYCQKCGTSCRVMDPPPDTCDHDQSLTAALVEANRNTAKWRTRAQKCQQALRRIRALTGDMSFALDEDWGADDDS